MYALINFVTFRISFVKDSSKKIHVNFFALKIQDRPTFDALSIQGFCHLCWVANTTQNFSEQFCMEKIPIKQFPFMGNVYYRDFIHFSVCIELYVIK